MFDCILKISILVLISVKVCSFRNYIPFSWLFLFRLILCLSVLVLWGTRVTSSLRSNSKTLNNGLDNFFTLNTPCKLGYQMTGLRTNHIISKYGIFSGDLLFFCLQKHFAVMACYYLCPFIECRKQLLYPEFLYFANCRSYSSTNNYCPNYLHKWNSTF